MVEEVKLRRKYLNEGDVFILDLGLHIIQVSYANPSYLPRLIKCFAFSGMEQSLTRMRGLKLLLS